MNIIEILFSTLNVSPFLTISCDELFGGYKKDCKKRYSFASLGLGSRKFYLFTYHNKFKFIETIDINSFMPWPSKNDVDKKVNKYKKELENFSDEEATWQKEFLENRIQDQNSSDSTLQSKVTTFTAINAVIIPAIISSLIYSAVNNPEHYKNWLLVLLVATLIYNVLNQIIFLYYAYNVKGRIRPRFSDLKKNSNVKELASSYYTHWASAKEEVRCIAGYIKNIEKYLMQMILCSASLFVFLTVNFTPYQAAISGSFSTPITEVSIINAQGDIRSQNLDNFLSLLKSSLFQKSQKIYVISNLPETSHPYQNVQTILETFFENDRIIKLRIKTLDHKEPMLIIKTD